MSIKAAMPTTKQFLGKRTLKQEDDMPLYQYECRTCEQSFERRQSFSDDPLTNCPLCGAENAVDRVITPVGVIFKGSGFYINDSKSSSRSNGSSPKSHKSKTSDSKSSETKESKVKASEKP